MTQEEWNEYRVHGTLEEYTIASNKYITSLEQRIAELEEIANSRHELTLVLCSKIEELAAPKTCEGCKYEANTPLQPPCNLCSRQGTDRYEPKETKGV